VKYYNLGRYIHLFIHFHCCGQPVSYLSDIQTPKALVLDLVKHCGEVTEDPDAEMSTSAMLSLGEMAQKGLKLPDVYRGF